MQVTRTKRRRGFAMVEFTMLTIPIVFLTITIVNTGIAMWQFHSMVYSIETAARYAITHGRGCTQNGNSCAITLGNVATVIKNQAPGLDSSKFNVTLTTGNGSTVTNCNPLNTCLSSTAQFPSSTDNGVNLDVKLVGTCPVANPLTLFWPGSGGISGGTFNLRATSRQRIIF
jgi:Flp pilus assembly protein TadG